MAVVPEWVRSKIDALEVKVRFLEEKVALVEEALAPATEEEKRKMATSFKYHPKQPDKKLSSEDQNLPVTPAATEQKSKKLGELEHDLTSFENEPWKSPAKKRKGGKQLTK